MKNLARETQAVTPLRMAQAQTLSDLRPILPIFAFSRKSELQRFCRNFELTGRTLAAFILNSHLFGYAHFRASRHWVPKHLALSEEVVERIRKSGEENRVPIILKHLNAFNDRKLFVGHLFYRPSEWHLFFFDQRARASERNQFKLGPHIHFMSYLTRPDLSVERVAAELDNDRPQFTAPVHIRYRD